MRKLLEDILAAIFGQAGGGFGASVSVPLGSGYSTAEDTAERVQRLLTLQEEAVSNSAWLRTPDGRTFCNRALAFVAQGMGYFFPAAELANDMIDHMAADPRWTEDSMERAHSHAMRGGVAVAALQDHPHGHVGTLAPLPMEESTTWVCAVPMIANVGEENGIMRLSGAVKAADRYRLRFFLLALEDA